jgi:hypothetical protein
LEKPSNIDVLYLDVMSPEFEILGTGVTAGRQATRIGRREALRFRKLSDGDPPPPIGFLETNLVS